LGEKSFKVEGHWLLWRAGNPPNDHAEPTSLMLNIKKTLIVKSIGGLISCKYKKKTVYKVRYKKLLTCAIALLSFFTSKKLCNNRNCRILDCHVGSVLSLVTSAVSSLVHHCKHSTRRGESWAILE